MQLPKKFLWFCAGAKVDVLERCPTEHVKYSIIGTSVLLTALLACLAGASALYSVFDSAAAAAVFGILWALLIFNFNRFVLSSMKGDQAWWLKALSALFRVGLAVIVAFIISFPLELQIFRADIREQIETEDRQLAEARERQRAEQAVADDKEAKQIQDEERRKQIRNWNAEIDRLNRQVDDEKSLRQQLEAEKQSLLSQLRTPGLRGRERSNIQKSINERNTGQQESLDRVKGLKVQIEDYGDKIKAALPAEKGPAGVEPQKSPTPAAVPPEPGPAAKDESKYSLLRQLIAFYNMQSRRADEGSRSDDGGAQPSSHELFFRRFGVQVAATTFWTAWFIRFVLIFIETAPVFIKLFTRSSRYDELMSEIEADDEEDAANKHLIARFNQRLRQAAEKAMRGGETSAEQVRQIMSCQLAYDRRHVVLLSDLASLPNAPSESASKDPLEVIGRTIDNIQTLLKEPADVEAALGTISELLQRLEGYLTPALGSDEALNDILKDLEKLPLQIRSANVRRGVAQRA